MRALGKDILLFGGIVLFLAFTVFNVWLDNHIGNECVAAGHAWWYCRHFGFVWWVFS
jgi:hypothetical protein